MCTHTKTHTNVRPSYKAAIYLYTVTAALHSQPSLDTWASLQEGRDTKQLFFTKWLFDLDAPANVFRLTQSVPLASMLSKATRSPTVWCNGQGSGLLLSRQHRHRVYCPRRRLGSRPAALLHLGPPRGMAVILCVRPRLSLKTLTSPLIGALHASLEMSSENKHRMKDGKPETSHRGIQWAFPCHFNSAVPPPHFTTHTHTSAVNSSQRAVPFFFLVKNTSESTLRGRIAQTKQQEQTLYWFVGSIQNRVMQYLAPSSSPF